ncbi:GDSL-type esterase/lipase family protein [Flavobacterium cellulosilyticum]|uniref:Sialate O-acetylesterase n=1 Tax=Flavobacterium cellulosilyticum TaxID=2541731 RepID=A0A4R5CD30_9FLAO|nr:GDSL-type esterase/lipase family protein [Flavobacterium cellulosilyticum]TDD96153.1 sialate O-acetylesterase [Flavobacterium cellulosilyticum]
MELEIKLILGLSLIINVLLIATFAFKFYNNWFEIGVLKSSFRESIFNSAPDDFGKIYFVGDSDTEAFELNEFLQNKDVRNRGIWGDVSSNIIKRLDNIIRQRPKKIFLMIGQNDICSGRSIDTIIANVEQFIKISKASLPDVELYIESALPSNEPILHSKEKTIDRLKKLNAGYKILAKKHDVTYIDLFHHFIEDNEIKKEYSFDGSHLNGKGYLLLAKLLKPHVEI